MNKKVIRDFSVWARRKLISEITYKAGLIGVKESGIEQPLEMSTGDVEFFDIGTSKPYEIHGREIQQRNALVKRIKDKEATSDYKTAFQFVIEEVAYTWFNRLIAIRFMEVNEFLPSRVRVLSSEILGKAEPDLVTSPFDANMEFSDYEMDRIVQLKDENKLDELFRMLFIKQCNKLNEVLPELFEKTSDYTELLLTISFTDKEGIVNHLVTDISEEDFTEAVEIIGWMYQYYNEERKNEVINIYKGTIKKDDIPAATQLFTTDWVVRYMVDNSLGRYWIERNPQSSLREKLEFFVTPKTEDITYVNEKVSPEELTFFDPCMGSGHILVYAFDVLMEIYRECGYVDRDAAQAIIENNLFGLDIDNRAYQLAYFAVMMKARSYDRRFLTRDIEPNVAAIAETNKINKFSCDGLTNNPEQNVIGEYLVNSYKHAKEIGSLLTVEKYDYKGFAEYLDSCNVSGQITLESNHWYRDVYPLMKKITKQANVMSKKYTVVCTNPPYMNKLEGNLKKFVVEGYKPYSADLFSVFMYRNFDYCKIDGYSAFMTPFVWMFIKTYEKIRKYIITEKSITTLIQMEYSAYEEATVPICSFVLKNEKNIKDGIYFKLSEFKGGMEVQKKMVKIALQYEDCNYLYYANSAKFMRIPGCPIAYWISEQFYKIFDNKCIADYAISDGQTKTGNNDKYLRFIWEVNIEKTGKGKKWVPHAKGGMFRRWYGNIDTVIDWSDTAREHYRKDHVARIAPEYIWFRRGICWSLITSSEKFAVRILEENSTFNLAAPSLFFEDNDLTTYILGLLNSKVAEKVIRLLNPTINTNIGDILSQPLIYEDEQANRIVINKVNKNIEISKIDWDSFETSWEFKMHPLVKKAWSQNHLDKFNKKREYRLADVFNSWECETKERFEQLKSNEEDINRVLIELYNLQDELDIGVEDKDITVSKGNLEKDIKSFISYAVGCMFGRYSLDREGLSYAGGEWNMDHYTIFTPNSNNCIPITDEEYFEDDIVGLFVAFVKKVYGEETLEENLEFIANAVGNKGITSREIIRNYFIKDFYKDHVKMYQKRPIYWLYDSGKQNGFKALIYMHRYNPDTTGTVRIEYLNKIQKKYTSEIERMQDMIDNGSNSREIAQAEKRKEKLVKQLKETKEYDEKIGQLAISRIPIDLDDGVKVNYEKIQTAENGKKIAILAKI